MIVTKLAKMFEMSWILEFYGFTNFWKE